MQLNILKLEMANKIMQIEGIMLNEIESKVILKFFGNFFEVRDCDWGGMACNTPGGGE